MKYIIFVHYFFINLLGFATIPHIIQVGGKDWFSTIYDENAMYYAVYSRYINRKDMEDLFLIESKFKYILYLKTIAKLWKLRKNIIFGIDIN